MYRDQGPRTAAESLSVPRQVAAPRTAAESVGVPRLMLRYGYRVGECIATYASVQSLTCECTAALAAELNPRKEVRRHAQEAIWG